MNTTSAIFLSFSVLGGRRINIVPPPMALIPFPIRHTKNHFLVTTGPTSFSVFEGESMEKWVQRLRKCILGVA